MIYIVLVLFLAIVIFIFLFSNKNVIEKDKECNLNSKGIGVAQNLRYIAWNEKYSLDVVGESHYQLQLSMVAGEKKSVSKDLQCYAVLIREPNNVYDSNAVMVVIKGSQVGYLSRSKAASLVKEMNRLHLSSNVMFVVKAKINGGWRDGSSEGSYGVVLDFPPINRISSVISSVSMEDSEQKFNKKQ